MNGAGHRFSEAERAVLYRTVAKRRVFGRRTLPEMSLASVACAIQNMSLATRAENPGLGRVSMFNRTALAELLDMPQGTRQELIFHNTWGNTGAPA